MTQGRNPRTEADDASTLFEPSRESSGLTSHATPAPSTASDANAAPTTDTLGGLTSYFGTGSPTDSSGADELSSGDLPTGGLSLELDSATALKQGQVLFDRYIVERELGRGGMGIVLLVRHRELGSERALKLIISGIARDEQARLRFRREARILDRLNHPNAVRVYDARMGKDVAFIEMEYVRGSSLNQVLTPGVAMPLEWVADLLDQLCSVLQAASEEGIIHRDLKPQNLMLVDGRQPGTKVLKLLDFGIAKIREGADDVRTLTGSFMGTPLYSSPEQIVGEKVDSRSDIYSVGLILCELLTGFRPFDGSMNAVIYKHTMVPPPAFADLNPDAGVPPEVEQVVRMCLAKEPEKRPQTLRELSERFHQAMAGIGPDLSTDVGTEKKASVLTGTFETTTATPTKFTPRPVVEVRVRLALAFGGLGLLILLAFVITSRIPDVRMRPNVLVQPSPVASAPKAVRPPTPGDIAKQVVLWKSQGYNVVEPARTSPAGWPLALVRGVENVRFERDPSGIYLPKGYEPGSDRTENGYPRLLERKDGTNPPVKFMRIEGGKFRMGSLRAPDTSSDESQPGPLVVLSAFYMQETEVTNGEIEPLLKTIDPNAEAFKEWRTNYRKRTAKLAEDARRLPASSISWQVAADYARTVGGRLPTEAQWEYAARSQGQQKLHVWGSQDTPKRPGNIGFNQETDVVGSYDEDVTTQGIRDLSGNVREWCRDVWKDDPGGTGPEPRLNPQDPPSSAAASNDLKMAVRGGAFQDGLEQGRTIARSSRNGGDVTNLLGFRIVIECPEGPPDVR